MPDYYNQGEINGKRNEESSEIWEYFVKVLA